MKRLVISLLLLAACSQEQGQYAKESKFFRSYEKELPKKVDPRLTFLSYLSSEGAPFAGIRAMATGTLQQDEALSLFTTFVEDYLVRHERELGEPLNLNKTNFSLTFWTKDLDRPGPDFAAQIILKEGKVRLYHKEVASEFLDEDNVFEVAYDQLSK